MIRLLLLLFLIPVSIHSFGQSQQQKDSLINEMCNTLQTLDELDDISRIEQAYEQHLYPYLAAFPESQQQELGTSIYFRCQRNCKIFTDLLSRIESVHEDWKSLTERPESEMSPKDCKFFKKRKNFWYHESNGDTVRVEIKDGFWTDQFSNDTYSKLNFAWVSQTLFEIEFIASNNESRKNFSKPGDRYRYELLKKNEGYFDVLVEIPDGEYLMKFKLYMDK